MRIFIVILMAFISTSSFSKVNSYILDNGMKLLVKEDHRAPVAVSMIWYNVGSSDEYSGITGISHVLEHMMFKGTKKYPQGEFSRILAHNGAEENAFTNYDYTAYYEQIAANRLEISFKLEADRMQNLLLEPQEFAKEIKVVREERRMRTDDNPQALTFERFMASAHLNVPYHHPVIGWMDDLNHMNIRDLKKWYQTYYAPNNATLVVVGDVEADKVHQLAKTYFGNIKISQLPDRKAMEEPPSLGKKNLKITVPAKLPLLMLGFGVPSVPSSKNYEPYALELIAGILDAGDSARFSKHIIRGKNVASNTEVYYNLYSRYPSQFILYGIPAKGKSMKTLEAALLEEIENLQTQKVSKEELQRVKNQIIAQKVFEKDSIFGQAMELGLLETVGAGWQASETFTQQIKQITPEQIQETAQKYFQQKAMTRAELIPLAAPERNS